MIISHNKTHNYSFKLISVFVLLCFLSGAVPAEQVFANDNGRYISKFEHGKLIPQILSGKKPRRSLPKDPVAAQRLTAAKAVKTVWEYIKKNIRRFDKTVAQKRKAFLSRLYHALDSALADAAIKAEYGRIDPFVRVNLMNYSPDIEDERLHDSEGEINVGYLPIGGNPLNWGHILISLIPLNVLNLDTVVIRVQPKINYKNLLASERVPIEERHFMVKESIKGMFPLVRYTDLGSEEDSDIEGTLEVPNLLELNKNRKMHLYYILGAENEARMRNYMRQQYLMLKESNFGSNPKHKITFTVIQRGEYGANVTIEELQGISEEVKKEIGFAGESLDIALVQHPDVDINVSSTYYRNSQDPAIVPYAVHKHSKSKGYYGNPPIDLRTGKPVTKSQEAYFRRRLKPVSGEIAGHIKSKINEGVPGNMPLISVDGGSGSGKTTVGQEIAKLLKLRRIKSQIIPLDIFLRYRPWRMGVQALVTGRRLSDIEKKALLADLGRWLLPGEKSIEIRRNTNILESRKIPIAAVRGVIKYLEERGLDRLAIPDSVLADRTLYAASQKVFSGEKLDEAEEAALTNYLETRMNIMPGEKYLEEEDFFDKEKILNFLKKIDEFRRSGEQSRDLIVPDAYNQETKKMEPMTFHIEKGEALIFDGKYANQEGVWECFDLRYRLHDAPDRTEARFQIRSRRQDPDSADKQIFFYDLSLVPSYEVYDKRTEGVIDGFIDLRGEEWFLKGPLPSEQALLGNAFTDKARESISKYSKQQIDAFYAIAKEVNRERRKLDSANKNARQISDIDGEISAILAETALSPGPIRYKLLAKLMASASRDEPEPTVNTGAARAILYDVAKELRLDTNLDYPDFIRSLADKMSGFHESIIASILMKVYSSRFKHDLVQGPLKEFRNTKWVEGFEFFSPTGLHDPSGYDRTTELMFLTLEDYFKAHPASELDICDMGCGLGALSVFVAKHGPKSLIAVDNDTHAIDVAKTNIENYGLSGKIELLKSDLFGSLSGKKFDLIIFNIPGEPQRDWITKIFFERLPEYLKEGGSAIVTWPKYISFGSDEYTDEDTLIGIASIRGVSVSRIKDLEQVNYRAYLIKPQNSFVADESILCQ